MPADIQKVVLRDSSNGRYHEAIRLHGGEPMLHDACNVIGDRVYMDDLPAGVADADLCKRCFGGKTT